MSLRAFRALALTRTARAKNQTRTLYLCEPRVAGSTQQSPQLTRTSAERWSYDTTHTVSSMTKDPTTSATVDVASLITMNVKCLDKFEKPIATVWAEAATRKNLGGVGTEGLENNDWQI
jgi:hypothetical protein